MQFFLFLQCVAHNFSPMNSSVKKCATCGSEKSTNRPKLQKCSTCNLVRYCSKECQKTHWGIHKAVCKDIVERQKKIANTTRLNEILNAAIEYLIGRDLKRFESLINENLDVLNHQNQSEEFDRRSLLYACVGIACRDGNKDFMKMLLDRQADVNIQNVRGTTPLYLACQQGHKDVVKMLLDKQADINIPKVQGWTPLAIAIHKGHEEISELLRQYGGAM